METYFHLSSIIGRGAPRLRLVLGLGAHHALSVCSHWPAEIQDKLFTEVNGDFIAPHRAPPAGKATPVEGGYVITGEWRYSSGVPSATHFIDATFAPGDDPSGPPAGPHVHDPPQGVLHRTRLVGRRRVARPASERIADRRRRQPAPDRWLGCRLRREFGIKVSRCPLPKNASASSYGNRLPTSRSEALRGRQEVLGVSQGNAAADATESAEDKHGRPEWEIRYLWSSVGMVKAGWVEKDGSGVWKATPQGIAALEASRLGRLPPRHACGLQGVGCVQEASTAPSMALPRGRPSTA